MPALVFSDISDRVLLYLPRLGSGLLVMVAFLVVALVVESSILRLARNRKLEENLGIFLGKSAKYALLAFGLVSGLGTLGVDVGAMVAGLGLTGFALGFALKDIISNQLAGVLIMIYRPFRNGDKIKVAAFEGRVLQIDMRYTHLEGSDGSRIYVPNSMLFTNAITVSEKATGAPPASQD